MAQENKKIRIRLVRGLAGTAPSQRANLRGLGLKRRHQVRELEDTPAVRGMINVVRHMIEVED
jgi:large subunit ribosomal protein L30